uniref:Uncharacterized protein n=1 Tax=Panagrolaimus superbus TaxID=310955 RepID=A0A914YFW8_9BILA
MEKGPDIVLYWVKINKTNVRKISADCKFFSYNYEYFSCRDSNACLLKARITSGDSDLFHLDTEKFLSDEITLKIENTEIASFKEGLKLPIFYSQKIPKESKNDVLKIHFFCRQNDIRKLPEQEENVTINFQIDTHEIYSVEF